MRIARGAKDAKPDANVKMFHGEHYVGKGAFVVFGTTTDSFFEAVHQCLEATEVRGETWFVHDGRIHDAVSQLRRELRDVHKRGGKAIFIGNGGSAAIASHMAVDWTKNGGIRSIAFNDAPTLTCLGNDFGYENVFAKQLEYYATKKDVVIIVSSSGKSANILRAADMCRSDDLDCRLVTLSGMNPSNQLRRMGNLNFYVPAMDYGLVELSHLCLLHSVVSVR